MLPKGTHYYFQSSGNENLVLLRVGAGRKPGDEFRLGTQGLHVSKFKGWLDLLTPSAGSAAQGHRSSANHSAENKMLLFALPARLPT